MNLKIFNLPNILSLMRIAAIPFIAIIYYLPFQGHYLVTAIIFSLAALTDLLDGYIARQWNLTSPFGAFIDPVADKLLVAVALVIIVAEHQAPLIALPAAVIIGREIVISALREWMAEMGRRASVAVSYIGKIKTTLQMVALIILLAADPTSTSWLTIFGYLFLYVAAFLTLWSMIIYLKSAWYVLKTDPKN